MTDEQIADLELDATNLRRHWRAMGMVQAWCAVGVCRLAHLAMVLAAILITRHSSNRTVRSFEELLLNIHTDMDIANEGLREAADISRWGK